MNKSEQDSEKISGQHCLVCGDETNKLKRGLCDKHYQQFRRKKESLTVESAEEWESLLVENGKLLPKQQGKKFGMDDPFADLFNEFVEANPNALKKKSETAEAILEIAKEKTKQHRQKNKD